MDEDDSLSPLLAGVELDDESIVSFCSLDCSRVSRSCWFSRSSLDTTRFKLAMKHFLRSRVILACILFRSRLKKDNER